MKKKQFKPSPATRVLRGLCSALVLVGLIACGGGGDAETSSSLDCNDFRYQQDAQAVLNADRSDPNNLDADDDGIACEHLPRR